MNLCPLAQAGPEYGAKAHVLARMLAAGLRVPDGFCVAPQSETTEILTAWKALGSPPVAVRSSAGVEDGVSQSFAGQFETVLDVADEAALVTAVAHTRASFANPQNYLGREAKSEAGGSVIVQAMVAARAAGVVFTLDPTCAERALRVEAAPGRGDALVSGRVRPAAWRLGAEDRLELVEGTACLDDSEVRGVVAAAREVQSLLGGELDLEFAFAQDGQLWVLQARPITAVKPGGGEELRQAEIARARSLSHPSGTVWSRYSLAETLASPLPMTWSIVRRMLSLRGAYGRLYRDLGFEPCASLEEVGVLDLICGRPYYNLSREVRLYFGDFPFVHPIEAIRADRRKASYPAPLVDISQAQPGFWKKLPGTLWKMLKAQFRLDRLRRTFAPQLIQEIAPAFLAEMACLGQEDLEVLDAPALLARLRRLVVRVVDDFAADSLKASAFAAASMALLERKHGAAGAARLLAGAHPLPEADLAQLFQRAARGELAFPELLQAIGHRGPAEMELAEPRWREMPERLKFELERMSIRERPALEAPADKELALAYQWLSLRETARHWLMLGWAEMRRNLLALDRCLGLEGGVFWLELDELPEANPALIAERRQRHRLCQAIPCPSVLFSDDLEAIGRAPVFDPARGYAGTPLSWGVAEGTALVVSQVEEIPAGARDYVLVCPTTDPAYTFAMTRALALVVETGGVLSHGAIVARELGLPALANIPIHSLKTGMRLRVDGERGELTLLDEPT